MKAKKVLSVILATVTVLSLVACGNAAPEVTEPAAEELPAPVEQTFLEGASIDFEDGNFAFATEASVLKGGDASALSVEDVNGSKVLRTTHSELEEGVEPEKNVYIGFDLNALLGDKIVDVNTIQFSIGVDGDFNAISGKLLTYTGDDLKETSLGDYSVYLETANPKTVSFDIVEPFIAGANNYIIISKDSDAAPEFSEMFIDNIGFFDADGNLIEADSSIEIASSSPLAAKAEEGVQVFHYEGGYTGDWTQTAVVPYEALENATENTKIIVDFVCSEPDHEPYCIAPISKDKWTKYLPEKFVNLVGYEADGSDAPEDADYYFKNDGVFSINNTDCTRMEFVISPSIISSLNKEGGLAFMVNGVKITAVTIADEDYEAIDGVEFAFNNAYPDDWALTEVADASAFEGKTEDTEIIVKMECMDGFEYYCIAPCTPDWKKVDTGYYVGQDMYADGEELPEGTTYHLKPDGVFGVDDTTTKTIKFTFTADGMSDIAAKGGLTFQVYGVTVSKVYVCN